MKTILTRIQSFILDEDAPTMVEYGLLVIVIALAVAAAASSFGAAVSQFFQTAAGYSN
jgi:Flp pilus assembly pilin Flp